MSYQVTHTTTYDYENAVSVSQHLLRLTPRVLPGQSLLHHEMSFVPNPALTSQHLDYFGNQATFVTVEGAHRQLTITVRTTIDLTAPQPMFAAVTPSWETVRELCKAPFNGSVLEPVEFAFSSTQAPSREAYAAYAAGSFPPGRPLLEAAQDLMLRIHREFRFDPK